MMNKTKPKKPETNDSDEEEEETKIVRENNHVYFYSDVSRDSIFQLNALLREAAKFVHTMSFELSVPNIPIYLHINSYGGSLYDAYAAVDTIKNLRVPIHSIIEGCAASAGTIISVVCNKRFIGANAYMLIHQLNSRMWGKMSELEDEYNHLTEMMEQITKLSGLTRRRASNMGWSMQCMMHPRWEWDNLFQFISLKHRTDYFDKHICTVI
jgi:ATP-dependent protease ClpP protease subunit